MNAVEQIVEGYFRYVKKCFTISDIKVISGNNRQMDLLAYSVKENKSYHIESSVTHRVNWNPKSYEKIDSYLKYKFLGFPRKHNNSLNSDFNKKKIYAQQIKDTYNSYGLNFDKIIRVCVFWCLDNLDKYKIYEFKKEFSDKNQIDIEKLEILSFREDILPELEKVIGTSNYEHEIIRTISLISEYRKQSNKI